MTIGRAYGPTFEASQTTAVNVWQTKRTGFKRISRPPYARVDTETDCLQRTKSSSSTHRTTVPRSGLLSRSFAWRRH
jgi:hypothetical protein